MGRIFRTVLLAVGLASLLAACQMFEAPDYSEYQAIDITTLAVETSVIDFEDLPAGTIVDSVSHGAGISGWDTGGSVDVDGYSSAFGAGTNAAIIFDATCGGAADATEAEAQCSGDDDDLWDPELGKILIIAEDLVDDAPEDGRVDDPDDADLMNMTYYFDFSTWADAETVTIGTLLMNVIDVESAESAGAEVTLYSNSDYTDDIVSFDVPATGDGVTGSIEPVNVSDVASMKVVLNGSGGIDNITLSVDVPATGCTPGFWMNWTGNDRSPGPQPNAWPAPYTTETLFSAVFAQNPFGSDDLYDVVSSPAGGLDILGFHTVAALLNAAHGLVAYPLTEQQVKDMFNAVDLTSSSAVEELKDTFAAYNEAGCPLNENVYTDPGWATTAY